MTGPARDEITSTTSVKTPDLPPRAGGRFRWSSIAILIPLVAVFVALSIGSPAFLSMRNLSIVLDRESAPLLIAAAWTLVLIAGGFDLSVGATYYLSSVVTATIVIQLGGAGGTVLGIVIGILLGIVVGVISGIVSTYLRINSLIATLAMNFIVVGVANLVSQIVKSQAGQLRVTDPSLTWISTMLRAPAITLPTYAAFIFLQAARDSVILALPLAIAASTTLFAAIAAAYALTLLALRDQPLGLLLKRALLGGLARPLPALATIAVVALLWLLHILFYPVSIFMPVLINFSFGTLAVIFGVHEAAVRLLAVQSATDGATYAGGSAKSAQ